MSTQNGQTPLCWHDTEALNDGRMQDMGRKHEGVELKRRR